MLKSFLLLPFIYHNARGIANQQGLKVAIDNQEMHVIQNIYTFQIEEAVTSPYMSFQVPKL